MRYFEDRTQAGKILLEKIGNRSEFLNPAIISIGEGGVLVGAEIAKGLHGAFYLLATDNIELPGEGLSAGTISSEGNFLYNSEFSTGEMQAIQSEFRQIIDEERYRAFQRMNRLVGKDGEINKNLLKRHEIILVSDGFQDSLSLEVAVDFIKPIHCRKTIIATPLATIDVVDKMRILGDDAYYLSILEGAFGVNHYYNQNDIPKYDKAIEIVKNTVFNW